MEKQVIPFEVPWSAEVAHLLTGATGTEPTYSISDLQNEVETGRAQLFQWHFGDEVLGYSVLWIDAFGGLSEMVVQAGAAFKSDKRAFRLVMPVIETMAKNQGCYAVRSHLVDGRWAGNFRSAGFYKSEVVMRKRL